MSSLPLPTQARCAYPAVVRVLQPAGKVAQHGHFLASHRFPLGFEDIKVVLVVR